MLLKHRLGQQMSQLYELARPATVQTVEVLLTTPGAGTWTADFDGLGLVEVIAGGGGGAGGATGVNGGGGGAGGGCAWITRMFTKDTVYAYYIGNGGKAGAGGKNASNGEDSFMTSDQSIVIAYGGYGGKTDGSAGLNPGGDGGTNNVNARLWWCRW